MVFCYKKLRGRIREKFGTEAAFAAALGMSRTSLSLRLNNAAQFTKDDMEKSADLLSFPIEEIHLYFFCDKSSETRTNYK